MVVTSRRVKKQVKKNAMDVDSAQRNGRIVFNRKVGKAKTVGSGGGFSGGLYMVMGPTSIYGQYRCLQMIIDTDTIDAGFDEDGVKLKSNSVKIGPVALGPTGAMGMGYYERWILATSYSKDDVVAVGYQVFISKQNSNAANPPITSSDWWQELTVTVFNLNEWVGWDSVFREPPNQNPAVSTDGVITELQPKLTHLDTITVSVSMGQLAGFDNIGSSRLFMAVYDVNDQNEQKLHGYAIKENGQFVEDDLGSTEKFGHERDSLYNIELLNYVNFNFWTDSNAGPGGGDTDANQQWWHADGVTSEISEKVMRCTWIKGTWYFVPEIEIRDADISTLTTNSFTYAVGRLLGDGLDALSGSDEMIAKVDGTSIDFNISGELKQIP